MIMNAYLMISLQALASFAGVWWIFFKILRLAKEKNLVDNPDFRKLQKIPVPVVGGIAVFFGLASGIAIGAILQNVADLGAIFPAMLLMLYVGALDDILSLTPRSRLVIEIATVACLIYGSGGCVDSLHGLFGLGDFSWYYGVPLTLFAGVGIINAINMIDGVNGLSSGLCILCSAVFGIIFFKNESYSNAGLAFCMAAALVPFWLHNVFGRTSKMFIGDAGTMVMGVLMTWFVIQILRHDTVMNWSEDSNLSLVAMTLAILVVPIFDTLRVMLNRMRKRLSPFSPDKTHLHHIFIEFGMSHSVTGLIIILIDALVIACWYTAYNLGISMDVQFILVVVLGCILVWGTYVALRCIERFNKPLRDRICKITLSGNPEKSHWWDSIRANLDKPERTLEEQREKRDELLRTRNQRKFQHNRK